MRFAVTGAAGFLALHLIRRLASNGELVRGLDVVPLEEPVPPGVEQIRGDVRDPAAARAACRGVDVLVHAAAALPIQRSARAIYSVNVDGTRNVLEAAVAEGVRRVVFVSSTAVYGFPEDHPVVETSPLAGVGAYGRSKIEAEALCARFASRGVEHVILRPKTFLGPERLGIFEILFRWVYEGRRIYVLGDGTNRYQLLDVEDLVDAVLLAATEPDAVGEAFNLGASVFGSVRSDLEALIRHAGSSSRLTPLPVRAAELALRCLEVLRLSPLSEWHYRTASRDSYVDVSKAHELLHWAPQLSNAEALCRSYDWYIVNRHRLETSGVTHRRPWKQRSLGLLRRLS
jgi:nucleoside-diphosphate-sugar epimerase